MTKTEEPNDFYFQFLLSVNPNSFTDIYKDVTLNVVLELTGLPEELSGKDLGYYLHCEDKVYEAFVSVPKTGEISKDFSHEIPYFDIISQNNLLAILMYDGRQIRAGWFSFSEKEGEFTEELLYSY